MERIETKLPQSIIGVNSFFTEQETEIGAIAKDVVRVLIIEFP